MQCVESQPGREVNKATLGSDQKRLTALYDFWDLVPAEIGANFESGTAAATTLASGRQLERSDLESCPQ